MVNEPVQQQKRGALIAGIGALVGIAAFLLLPYLTITLTLTSAGYGGEGQTTPIYNQSFSVGTGFVTLFSGIIWIEALLAIAVLVLAALVSWRDAPFGNSAMPVATQLRRAAYTTFILGIVAILFQFLFVSIGNGQINQMFQSASLNGPSGSTSIAELLLHSNAALSVSMGYAIGSWFYLLAMGAVIFGGVQMLRAAGVTLPKPQVAAQPQAWQQPSQYEQQNWQQTGPYSQQQSGPYPQQQTGPYPQQQGWQQPVQPQQPWQQPSQELPTRQPTQDWQGWQQPPSRPL